MIVAFLPLIAGQKSNESEEYTPLESPYPPLELSTPPPPPPKSPHELKLEKANEMRDNPTPAEKRMWVRVKEQQHVCCSCCCSSRKCLQGFGLRVGKKKKVEKRVLLLLLVNWLVGKWLSSLSERRRTGCPVGKYLFFFFPLSA